MPPALYIVSTPIGNLEDITLRALRILKEVDLIAAEDTRHTAVLLDRYDIRTPTTSFHEHNEKEKTPALLKRLKAGETVALVSDSGTPSISDPGYRLVGAARSAGVPVVPVPGPSAVLAALVSSGFPTDSFLFLGFPPRKSLARRKWAVQLARENRTVVFFESPHRLQQTLEELASYLVDRPIMVGRELTKLHEELVIRPINELLKSPTTPRGEYVIVVPPGDHEDANQETPSDQQIAEYLLQLPNLGLSTKRDRIRSVAEHFRLPSRTVYAALERTKKRRRVSGT
ncbi:MAG: 16S rRNA (cytidine(1402)-2'-O)-methyltransferase [Vicinamibacterales bacterium]